MNYTEWEKQYFSTPKRAARMQLLDERIAEEGKTEETEFLRQMAELRYKPEKGETEEVDHMIRGIMFFKLLKDRNKLFSFYPKKELKAVYTDLGMELGRNGNEKGKSLWFKELKHACKVFLSLCVDDKAYGSTFLGLIRLTNSALKCKIVNDVVLLVKEIPEQLRITEDLKTFSEAMIEAYNETFPEERYLLEQKLRDGGEG